MREIQIVKILSVTMTISNIFCDFYTHYSKSQIVVQKFNFDKTFSGNQSCQQLKSANPQYIHEFFTQNFIDNFSREIKVVNS